MFLFNFVIAAIEFGIIALVSFLSDKHIAGYIVCGVVFIALSAAFNLFVVRRSNLKTVYFIYGLAVNTAVCAIPTALIALLA